MTASTDTAGRRPGPPGGWQGRKGPDLTVGPIGKTLIVFALPVLGSNILQSLNGSANAIWVSHVLGEAALTATSNANQIFFMMLGAAFGVTMAANIMIGQAIGARDDALAKKVVGTATTFFVVISLLIGVIGGAATPHILDAMRTPAAARADAIAYLRVIFAAMPFMYFFSFVMMAQRGTGDSRTPFYFSLLAVGLDVVLNPMLIMGIGPFPRLGIAGSATSTLVSQTFTLGVMLIHLYRTRSILVMRPSEFHLLIPDLGIIKTLVLKGLPMGFQMIVISLAAVTMMMPTRPLFSRSQRASAKPSSPGKPISSRTSAGSSRSTSRRSAVPPSTPLTRKFCRPRYSTSSWRCVASSSTTTMCGESAIPVPMLWRRIRQKPRHGNRLNGCE